MYIPQIDGTLLSTMKKILLEIVFKMWGKVFFIMILKSFLLMSLCDFLVILVGLERKKYLKDLEWLLKFS